MIRLSFLFCLLLGLSAAFVPQAFSAETRSGNSQYSDDSHRGDPIFRFLVRKAMASMAHDFDFTTLRARYTQTSQYDPLGDKTIDEMLKLAYTIQNEPDHEKVVKALEEYRLLIIDHMANLKVVLQAYSLSKLDRKLGNPDFFKWMKEGLAKSVIYSGDGKSKGGAYDAITLSEETILFTYLNLKRLDTKSTSEGPRHYNVHEVQDIKTGQKWTMFVDVSYPVNRMQHDEKEKKNLQYDIYKQ